MLCPEPLVPKVHRISGFRLVLATPPLEQPPDCVPVYGGVGRLDGAEDGVLHPSAHQSIKPSDHNLLVQEFVPAVCQLANPVADAWTLARLGRVPI